MSKLSRRDMLRAMAASAVLPIVSRVPTVSASADAPNILFVVADALSARHMSLYGYDLDNTPNLKRLAERGTVFHNHYAAGNYTTPGTASLLTGTMPWTHRALSLLSVPAESTVDLGIFQQFSKLGYHTLGFTQNMNAATVMRKLDSAIDTIINYDEWHLHYGAISQWSPLLPDNDYQVKSIADDAIAGWQNGLLFTSFLTDVWEIWRTQQTLKQDGDLYPLGYPQFDPPAGSFKFNEVVDGITDVITQLPEPFMAYVHLFPPHAPYRPTAPFYDKFKANPLGIPQRPPTPFDEGESEAFMIEEQNAYDAFVAEVDAEFGRMMQMLEANGTLDNTWVIFTSDHGELFGNGHTGHSTELMSDDLLRVPLVIFTPETTARQDVFSVTSCVDLIPTLLHAAGETPDERYEGELLPGFGGDESAARSVFAVEAKRLHRNALLETNTSLMIRNGRYKLETYLRYDGVQSFNRLFDLDNDPLELNDISDDNSGVVFDLTELLTRELLEHAEQTMHKLYL